MSRIVKKSLVVFFLTALFISSYSQETVKPNRYLLSPRFFCGVPHPLANKALRNTFVGIYDINPSLNISPFAGFQMGIAYKHSLLTIPANKIAGLQETGMNLNNAAIRFGYDHYSTKTIFISYFLNFGQSYTSFRGVPVTDPRPEGYKYSSLYFEPEISVNFLIEDFFAIGICASFNYMEHKFDPAFISLDDYATYLASDYRNPTGILNVGFGFYYGFSKQK